MCSFVVYMKTMSLYQIPLKTFDESSSLEIPEETVLQAVSTIPNENPLWTTSVMSETDDLLKDDFEENSNFCMDLFLPEV